MLRVAFVALVLIIFAPCLFAQNQTSGKVIDKEDGTGVAGAYVTAHKGNSMLGYAFTDGDGFFTLKTSSVPDALKVTILGYEVKTIDITDRDNIVIALTQRKMELKSAVVTERVIEESGDTITYSAAAFRQEEDLVLSDILKKLPDITVTQQGAILHKGEYISHFYVEGMDLMGSRYGVVSNNLSAKDIAKIEVLQRHQPVRALKGLETPSKSAINIVLKESAKGSWVFGLDVALGVSAKSVLFSGRLMVSRFAKTGQDLFLIRGNNAGEDIIKDLYKLPIGKTGVFMVPQSGLDDDLSSILSPRRSSLDIPKEFWYDNLTGTLSLNHLSKLNETSQLRVSVQGALERERFKSGNEEEVLFNDGSTMTITEENSSRDVLRYLAADVSYENNANDKYISDKLEIDAQHRTYGSSLLSREPYSQNYSLPSLKLKNSLDMTFRMSGNKAFTITNDTKFVYQTHNADYQSDSSAVNQSVEAYKFQNTTSTSFRFRVREAVLNLGVDLDINYLSENTAATGLELGELLLDEQLDVFSLAPSAVLSTDFYLGSFEFRPSVRATFEWMCNMGGRNWFLPTVVPYLRISRMFGQNLEISVYVDYNMNHSDEESLLEAAVLTNYRSLSSGDNLRKSNRFSTGMNLSYSNNLSMIYWGAGARYSTNSSNRVSSSYYTEDYTVQSWLDLKDRYKSYGFNANISKYFGVKTLVLSLSGAYNVTTGNSWLQGESLSSTAHNTTATIGIKSSALSWLTVSGDVSYDYTQNTRSSDLDNHRITLKGNLTVRPVRAVSIIGDVYYSWYKVSELVMENRPLVSVGVDWRLKKLTLFARCNNILNVGEIRRAYTSPYQTMTYYSKLRGCEGLLGIRMSL